MLETCLHLPDGKVSRPFVGPSSSQLERFYGPCRRRVLPPSARGRRAGLLHVVEAEADVAGVGRRRVGRPRRALRAVRVHVNVERFHETWNGAIKVRCRRDR